MTTLPNTPGIYLIENTANGKCYVGSAMDMLHRWQNHRSKLRGGKHGNIKLQSAFTKYGESAFAVRVLEACPPDQLASREQYWIDSLQVLTQGYNLAPQARTGKAIPRTPEQNAQKAARMRELWADPDWRAAQHAKRQAALADPETRARLIHTGRKQSPEERERRGAAIRDALAANPEEIARRRQASREYWDDPEKHARHVAKLQVNAQDPAWRERVSRGTREGIARRKAERALDCESA